MSDPTLAPEPPSRTAMVLCVLGALAVGAGVRDADLVETVLVCAGLVGVHLVTRSPLAFVGLGIVVFARVLVRAGYELIPASAFDDPSELEREIAPLMLATIGWLSLVGYTVAFLATRRIVGTFYTVLVLAFVALSLFMRPVLGIAEPEDPWLRDNELEGIWLIAKLLDRLLLFRFEALALIAGAFFVTGVAPQGPAGIGRAPAAILGALGAIGANAYVGGLIVVPEAARDLLALIAGGYHVLGWLLLAVSLALHAREHRSVAGWIAAALCAVQVLCCCGVLPVQDEDSVGATAPRIALIAGHAGLAVAALGIRGLPHRPVRIVAGVLAALAALGGLGGLLAVALRAGEVVEVRLPPWPLELLAPCGAWALTIWLVLHALRPAGAAPAPAAAAPSPTPTPT